MGKYKDELFKQLEGTEAKIKGAKDIFLDSFDEQYKDGKRDLRAERFDRIKYTIFINPSLINYYIDFGTQNQCLEETIEFLKEIGIDPSPIKGLDDEGEVICEDEALSKILGEFFPMRHMISLGASGSMLGLIKFDNPEDEDINYEERIVMMSNCGFLGPLGPFIEKTIHPNPNTRSFIDEEIVKKIIEMPVFKAANKRLEEWVAILKKHVKVLEDRFELLRLASDEMREEEVSIKKDSRRELIIKFKEYLPVEDQIIISNDPNFDPLSLKSYPLFYYYVTKETVPGDIVTRKFNLMGGESESILEYFSEEKSKRIKELVDKLGIDHINKVMGALKKLYNGGIGPSLGKELEEIKDIIYERYRYFKVFGIELPDVPFDTLILHDWYDISELRGLLPPKEFVEKVLEEKKNVEQKANVEIANKRIISGTKLPVGSDIYQIINSCGGLTEFLLLSQDKSDEHLTPYVLFSPLNGFCPNSDVPIDRMIRGIVESSSTRTGDKEQFKRGNTIYEFENEVNTAVHNNKFNEYIETALSIDACARRYKKGITILADKSKPMGLKGSFDGEAQLETIKRIFESAWNILIQSRMDSSNDRLYDLITEEEMELLLQNIDWMEEDKIKVLCREFDKRAYEIEKRNTSYSGAPSSK